MSKVTPIKQAEPTPSAKANIRKANELLMFQFEVETGQYIDGYSDDRVAKESGMPVAWVTKRRESEYGPLKEPTEFDTLRCELSELSSSLSKLQSKLDDMSRRNGWMK